MHNTYFMCWIDVVKELLTVKQIESTYQTKGVSQAFSIKQTYPM